MLKSVKVGFFLGIFLVSSLPAFERPNERQLGLGLFALSALSALLSSGAVFLDAYAVEDIQKKDYFIKKKEIVNALLSAEVFLTISAISMSAVTLVAKGREPIWDYATLSLSGFSLMTSFAGWISAVVASIETQVYDPAGMGQWMSSALGLTSFAMLTNLFFALGYKRLYV